MAQSEQARLISSLMGKGYSMKDIAALTGRTPRYIGFARDSETKIGRGGKETHGKGQNLIPALRQLDEKGKLSPAEMPGRRTTKSGAVAKVRKGTTVTTTRRGVQHTRTTVKKALLQSAEPYRTPRKITSASGGMSISRRARQRAIQTREICGPAVRRTAVCLLKTCLIELIIHSLAITGALVMSTARWPAWRYNKVLVLYPRQARKNITCLQPITSTRPWPALHTLPGRVFFR